MAEVQPQVVGNLLEDVKELDEVRKLSLQARATAEGAGLGVGGLLFSLQRAGELISPWWSKQRDRDLDAFWEQSDHVSGSIGMLVAKVVTVPPRVLPRDESVKRHIAQAEDYN